MDNPVTLRERAKIVSIEKTSGTDRKGNTWHAVAITHTNPDGRDPAKERRTLVFDNMLKGNQALYKKVKELAEGHVVGFIKSGARKTLSDIVDESEIPKFESKKTWTDGSKGKFNEAAPKVGGVLHDAVALTTAIEGKNSQISTVKSLAESLLRLSAELEKNWNDGEYKPSATTAPTENKTMADVSADAFDLDDF